MKNKVLIFGIGVLIGIIIASIGWIIYMEIRMDNMMKDMNIVRPNKGNQMWQDGQFGNKPPFEEENIDKDIKKDDVEKGEKTNKKDVNLSTYTSNVTLTEKGEYNVTGSFEHTLIVDSSDAVTIVLNNVNITNNDMAAIVNIGKGTLTIKLAKGSVNNLTDGGSSEYDACVYSESNLVIEGEGKLNVYGKQLEGEGIAADTSNITINGGEIYIESEDDGINAGGDGGVITINGGNVVIKAKGDGIDSNKDLIINGGSVYTVGSSIGGDAGIDTDGKFEINSGSVIALGSDMLQKPDNSSKQKSICCNLTEKIVTGSKVVVKDSGGKEVANFEAKETFKTLIISNKYVLNGTYMVYVNGKVVGNSINVK